MHDRIVDATVVGEVDENLVEPPVQRKRTSKSQCSAAAHWDAIYIHMANVVFITSHHVHRMNE